METLHALTQDGGNLQTLRALQTRRQPRDVDRSRDSNYFGGMTAAFYESFDAGANPKFSQNPICR